MGGIVHAGGKSYQQDIIGMNGIVNMNGAVSNPPPAQRFHYQQSQPSGNLQDFIGMNGIIIMNGVSSPPPAQRFYYQGRQPSGK